MTPGPDTARTLATNTPDASATSPSGPTLTFDEARTWDLLKRTCMGPDNATKQKHLAARLRMSTRLLQDILKDLTEIHGKPIAASCRPPYGVFVVTEPEQAEDYVAQLKARALSCLRRVSALEHISLRASMRNLFVQASQDGPSESQTKSPVPTRVNRVQSGTVNRSLVCEYCGQWFLAAPGYKHLTSYCSAECRYRAANERKRANR